MVQKQKKLLCWKIYFVWPTLTHLVADGAHVVERAQLLRRRLRQRADLVDRRPALHEHAPAGARLTPDVEVRVDAHHQRPDRTAYRNGS